MLSPARDIRSFDFKKRYVEFLIAFGERAEISVSLAFFIYLM